MLGGGDRAYRAAASFTDSLAKPELHVGGLVDELVQANVEGLELLVGHHAPVVESHGKRILYAPCEQRLTIRPAAGRRVGAVQPHRDQAVRTPDHTA